MFAIRAEISSIDETAVVSSILFSAIALVRSAIFCEISACFSANSEFSSFTEFILALAESSSAFFAEMSARIFSIISVPSRS